MGLWLFWVLRWGHGGRTVRDCFRIVSSPPNQKALFSTAFRGWERQVIIRSNRSYNLRFGEISAGQPGSNARIETFTFNNDTYTRVAPPIRLPFDRVIVNRVNNPQVDFEKVTAFFCTPNLPSSPAPNNSTLYYGCDFVQYHGRLDQQLYPQSAAATICLPNQSGDTTVNNIERV